MSDLLVESAGVARTFGRGRAAVVAVHGVDCRVEPVARIAITGPSGSGKSTLLHLMAGLDEPTVGTVRWPALGDRDSLRPGLLGMVFQSSSLIPALDVTENVALPLQLGGHEPSAANERAAEALDRLSLGGIAHSLPDEISGGQAQRVAVARALAGEHRLILADEPTGQLDHLSASEVIHALMESADHLGAALIVATHDPEVADLLSKRWTMVDGRLDSGKY